MAERTKKSILRCETSRAAAKTISGLTAANPGVVTATAHGYSNGDVVYLSGIVGTTELNDRAFVAANVATNTFELKGVNTTNLTVYASGGSAFKVTLTKIAEVTGINIGGGSSQQIDVTNLESEVIEQLSGLPNLGSMTFDLTLNHTDTGQAAFRGLFDATTPQTMTLTTASGYVLCATGNPSDQSYAFALNEAQRGSFGFTIYRKLSYFA